MNKPENNPALSDLNSEKENNVDYSEVYRIQELKQLNKRLRKTRNILFICAIAVIGGALAFWILPETSFNLTNLLYYSLLAFVLALLGIFSYKRPYISLITGLIICIAFWAAEILLKRTDDLLIEGSIQKLFIVSLLISCLHTSKEAELIRQELNFS